MLTIQGKTVIVPKDDDAEKSAASSAVSKTGTSKKVERKNRSQKKRTGILFTVPLSAPLAAMHTAE